VAAVCLNAMDYARFCEMLLQAESWANVRLLAPRTWRCMRTNHVNPEALKTMLRARGGDGLQVVTDAPRRRFGFERHVQAGGASRVRVGSIRWKIWRLSGWCSTRARRRHGRFMIVAEFAVSGVLDEGK